VLLCRPLNLLGISFGVATSLKLAGGARALDGTDVAVVAGWVLLAAGGYLIDEARDRECDARFHPPRPIPSGLVSRELAFRMGTGLLAAGATVLIFRYAGIWVVGAATALVLYGYGGGLNPDVWQIWLADGTEFKLIKDPTRNLTPVDFTKINYVAVTYDDSTKKLNMVVYTGGVLLDTDLAHPIKDVIVAYSPVTDQTKSLLIGVHRPPVGSDVPVYHPFKARIHEVADHNRALPIGRVSSHILAGLHL
jgi:hypothetical protein